MRGLHPTSASDARLIRRSVSEPQVFAALFDRHARLIWSYACRRIGPSAADEIVSETFLRAFSHRGSYDAQQLDARPWLYGIATNVLREHGRSEARNQRDAQQTGDRDVADGELERAEARTDAAAQVPATAAALARLEPVDRETLLLYALADLSYEQIAVAMAVPTGTVRSRLHRARRLMRTQLGLAQTTATPVSESQDERTRT
jgi:RNA polymerase sigma-70 factor (ECF subfamily)